MRNEDTRGRVSLPPLRRGVTGTPKPSVGWLAAASPPFTLAEPDTDALLSEPMHPVLQLLVFWVLAFVSLSLAVVLLSIYSSIIDTDATLHSLGKETTIALIASLIEAASVWSVL